MIKALISKPLEIDTEGGLCLHLFPSEAEAILNRMEELGMLPPAICKNGYPFGDSYYANEWESEDEKK
jgi:hypothetical protein